MRVRGWVAVAAWALAANAQGQPSPEAAPQEPRLTFGGEALASVSTADNGFFNYTDYGQSATRLVRLNLDVAWRLGRRAAVLAEGRAETGDGVSLFALYLRLHPWRDRAVDIQVGRIPPTFGAFGRRTYGLDNPLIGYPLGYQYLTSLRPDAIPATADDVLRQRGRGWLTAYPLGLYYPEHGLPLVTANRWDTGVQVKAGSEPVSVMMAVTTGTLSNPLVKDDNDGKQVIGRVEVRPRTGLILGASAARGPFLSRQATDTLPAASRDGSFAQQALGLDFEYSRGYWLVRGEGILNEWHLPAVSPPLILRPLRAYAASIEGRYKIGPAFYVAGRADRLGFSSLSGTLFGGQPTPWDAPVWRAEFGGGYRLRRSVLLKVAYQHDWRDSYRDPTLGMIAAQALWWF